MKTCRSNYLDYLDYLARGSLLAGALALQGLLAASVSAQTNLAPGKSITASSFADVYVASRSNDANQGTYWESQNYAFPQTLTLDLGSTGNVNRVVLKLPAAWDSRTQTLSVSGSTDGSVYSTLAASAPYDFAPTGNNVVTINFPEAAARYVRLNITGNTGWSAGQIAEFEVYGSAASSGPRDAFTSISASSHDGMNGVQMENTGDIGGGQNVGWIDQGDWLLFEDVNFGAGAEGVNARIASNNPAGGVIEFRLGSASGQLIGTLDAGYTGGWQNWVTESTNVSASGASVSGTHDLYLVFTGGGSGMFNLNWFQFSADGGPVDPDPSVPAIPQNLNVTGVTNTSVSLAWNSATDAEGYEILRNGNVIADVTTTTYQDTGLAAGTTYAYTVQAYNQEGSSAQSNSVTATTEDGDDPTPPDTDNVANGQPVTATSTSAIHTATLAADGNPATYWESANNQFPQALTVDLGSTHYVSSVVLKLPDLQAWATRTQTLSILGSNDGASFETLVASAGYSFNPNTANTVTINFAEADARYVRLNITGNTGWAAGQIAEFEVYGYPDPVPPATPQNLVVAGGTSSSLYLTWSSAGLAEGYEILRDGDVIAEVTSNSYQDTGLEPNTSYSYTVRAFNQFGTSTQTNAITGTTSDTGPGPGPSDERGANMPYDIYQAEDAVVGGGAQIVGPNRIIGNIAGEASGRRAVTLNSTGSYVEFTTDTSTNTLVTRFSIPDAPGGGGITTTLNVYVNGEFEKALTLTSRHAWLYGNETNPGNSPGEGGPRHIYDEANIMFDSAIPAGSTIRLQKDSDNTSQYAIDFISLEQVAPIPNPNPGAYITPAGFSHQDVQNALDQARQSSTAIGIYLPAGTYPTAYKFQVHGKPLEVIGAGPWYTRFETPENQTNTDAGFSVNNSANGSTFANFAFFGNFTSRIDGPGKVFDFSGVSNITIDNIWAEHQVCMFWGANVHNTTIKNSRMRNLFADGLNFTNGSSGNHVVNNEARSSGDDSFALFGATDGAGGIVQNNLYENLTAMTPWRAAGLAVYGGQGNTFRNIHVEDSLVYSGVTISSLDFGYSFTGFQADPTTNFEGITILRSGGQFWGNQVFPALWMFSASDTFQGIRISDLDIIDPTFHGIMFQTNYVGGNHQNIFEDTIFTNVTISGAQPSAQFPNRSGFGIWANPMPEPGQGPAVGSVQFNNLTLINNAVNVQNDSPNFTIIIND